MQELSSADLQGVSKTPLRDVYDALPDGIFVQDRTGLIVDANPAAEVLLGTPVELLCGNKPDDLGWRIIDENNQPLATSDLPFARALARDTSARQVIGVEAQDGTLVWIEATAQPVAASSARSTTHIATTLRDVSHWRAKEDDLRTTLHQEKMTQDENSRFVSVVSHELRVPMNAIIGTLESLKRTPLDLEQEGFVQTIGDAGRGMIVLLNDLLDYAKADADKLAIRPVSVEVGGVISKCIELWQSRCEEKGLLLSFEKKIDEPAIASLDPVRVQQVLNNLLSNAIKFTHQGTIKVSAQVTRDEDRSLLAEISVIDNGPGIPEEQRHKLFTVYGQTDPSTSPHTEGTGLGLAIAKRLAVAMDGDILYQPGEESGSRFVFSFAAPIADSTEPQSTGTKTSRTMTTGSLNILAVDDNDANRKVVGAILSSANHTVTLAQDGIEAVNIATKETFDLILMDILMPDQNGIDTTRIIRQGEGPNSLTPIIALTANVMPEQISQYYATGMNGVVAKPIDVQVLLGEIANCAAPRSNAGH